MTGVQTKTHITPRWKLNERRVFALASAGLFEVSTANLIRWCKSLR